MKILTKIGLKQINWGLKILISLSGVVMLAVGLGGGDWQKPLSYAATVAIPFAPDFLKLFKIRASERLVLAYELFLIPAMVLGIDLDWYKTVMVTADGASYFDKVVHFASGALTVVAGKELLDKCYDGTAKNAVGGAPKNRVALRQYNRWFALIVLMGFCALVAVGWECFEFLYDEIAGGSMQELVTSGVADTMWDMIGAMSAGLITAVVLNRK